MRLLTSLTLRWSVLSTKEYKCLYVTDTIERILMAKYSEVGAGTMLHVVQQVRDLRRLELLDVRLRVTEVVDILIHLGSGLQHFGVSFNDQLEPSVARFKIIAETMFEHNRKLLTASAGAERQPNILDISESDEMFLTEAQSVQVKNGNTYLGLLLRRVRKHMPSLDMESINSWIDAVEWVDVVMEEAI